MNIEAFEIKELLKSMDDTMIQLIGIVAPLDEHKINTIPYANSWTAAQVLEHIIKSINGMAMVMPQEGKPSTTDAGARIPELKNIFLDFSTKMKSPEFIVPEDKTYQKESLIESLCTCVELLKNTSSTVNLTEQIENHPLGPITKWEMLHFALFHTQRHLQQLRNISEVLKNATP